MYLLENLTLTKQAQNKLAAAQTKMERSTIVPSYKAPLANIVWQLNRDFGPTLHESTHNGFLQIMHSRTFRINNPSDAKLASLSVLRKLSVSMATIVEIEKYKKCNISVHNIFY